MKELPQAFLRRMKEYLGGEYPAFLESYEKPLLRALRVNTTKIGVKDFLSVSPWPLKPVPGIREGFIIEAEAPGIGRHPYHLAGLFYMQEPSAMVPAALLAPSEGERILDLCAAPGGKSTAIAGSIGEGGLLVANEIVPSRAKVLLQNLQRMGSGNAVVTCAEPEPLCRSLSGFFDAVIVDAPCSGEGMFRKDDTAIREWSAAHVETSAQRQKAILKSAALALRPGGRLVYSTCTFSREENEDVIEDFIGAHPDFELIEQKRIYPHLSDGEGQFCALLRSKSAALPSPSAREKQRRPKSGAKTLEQAASALCSLFPDIPCERLRLLSDGRVILLPSAYFEMPEKLRLLCAGVEAGEMLKGRFQPSHALFQYCGEKCKNRISLTHDDAALFAFLRGETIASGSLSGYTALCVEGYPLGFGKAVGGTLKNHFPKGLRSLS